MLDDGFHWGWKVIGLACMIIGVWGLVQAARYWL